MRENLLEDHFVRPRNVGVIANADGIGTAGSTDNCGDLVKIFISVAGDRLTRVTFKTIGCPAAIASSSMTTELAAGRTLDEAAMIAGSTVDAALGGLPQSKKRCSNLGADALQAAIEDFISRNELKATRPIDKGRVAVAMSGGVDSSTAAAILKEEGYDVIGVTMRLYDADTSAATRSCCSPLDISEARSVAAYIGFPHFTVDFRDHFRRGVIDSFCNEYSSGRTPNPCMECNRQLKFGHLLEKATKLGAGHLATGHYVNILWDKDSNRWLVKRSADDAKDQSYMFWAALQDALAKFLTPLGSRKKTDIRRLAAELNLNVAAKEDSQEICFIPDNNYRRFLQNYAGYKSRSGPIVDITGKRLGTHRGLPYYTVGQRRGLGIAYSKPLYVLAIRPKTNTLVVGVKEDFDTRSIIASEINFIPFDALDRPLGVEAAYRYNMRPVNATIHPLEDSKVRVDFKTPQGGVAPGQSVVFYNGDLVIGGGIIETI